MGISSRFLWPVILLCLVLSLYLVHLRVLPCMHASFSQVAENLQWIFHWRGYCCGITHLLTFKELSSQEGCLDFQNEKHMVSYVLSGQGLASLLLTVMEFQFTGNELHPLSLGPIYLLPQAQTSSFCHTLYTESQQCGWHDPRSCHLQIGIATGICPLSLQGSNYELLQLLTFHIPWKEFMVESRSKVLCALGRLPEQVFR